MNDANNELSAARVVIDAAALLKQREAVWKLRWRRLQRIARRVGSFPELSIFGCYDGGNVGDLALGQSLNGIAQRLARTAFDSPKLVGRLTPPRAVVLAGGGVITARPGSPLHAFSQYVGRGPCTFSAVGVSATVRESELPEQSLRVLRGAAWLSTRSRRSATQLGQLLGRSDVIVQPDIAFALRLSMPHVVLPPRREKRLIINVSPFLHSRKGKEFVAHATPSPWFSLHLPDQAAWYERIGPSYARMVEKLVERFIATGWEVVSIPLAPEDDLFARSLLRNQRVRHLSYDSSPAAAVQHFASAERALVTRFHAHVFAILASTPLASFAYSPKCSDLVEDLGMHSQAQAQPRDWVHDFDTTLERLASPDATARLSDSALHELQARAYDLSRQGVLAALDEA
jgi:polysaccharide pyruvyl transferase WcaK-like protein